MRNRECGRGAKKSGRYKGDTSLNVNSSREDEVKALQKLPF
jgi:hypothetical protein